MVAHPLASPVAHVRTMLAAARRQGDPFEAVWRDRVSLACRNWPESEAWREAILATEPVWRRAYDRQPATAGDEAIVALAGDRVIVLDLLDERARRCAREGCGELIPVDRDPRAIYHSDRCRRLANQERERERAARVADARKDACAA
ncbi:MAG: hypothetical protein ACLP01_16680 [Solirubrobacteraceae bacterium]